MSYTIEQRIGDHTYLYEVESFWDPEKKQPRQRRKYLGKKVLKVENLFDPEAKIRPIFAKTTVMFIYYKRSLINWV